MRITSELWVAAFLRQHNAERVIAHQVQKGAPEAGAILIIQDHLDHRFSLFLPVPQMFAAGGAATGRAFEQVLSAVSREQIIARLDGEARMDSDFWVVEIEWPGQTPPPGVDVIDTSG